MKTRIYIGEGAIARRLLGNNDVALRVLRERLGVRTSYRRGHVYVVGGDDPVDQALRTIEELKDEVRGGRTADPELVESVLEGIAGRYEGELASYVGKDFILRLPRGRKAVCKTAGQVEYAKSMIANDIVFCTGPAGTGKTYLAVAMGLGFLREAKVNRIVLVRPAVEAGEKLGFLPGDFREKVNPYLRPLYDALTDMLPFGELEQYIEQSIVEVAPLAYMRGRTLGHSFVILDEAQNTTSRQMLMFLTRLGPESHAVITGDVTQIDLPDDTVSGLVEAVRVLGGVKGIGIAELTERDIVRHHLVKSIVAAYERSSKKPRG
ncbi:MAG: PhoH family protein [Planctomycetes bacterium]|nr:PhoH family protein [Planctomycetota bacterium]